jgi:hypothetical protein
MRIFIIIIVAFCFNAPIAPPSAQSRPMRSKLGAVPASYRFAVASRVIAAVFAGYLLAALSSVFVGLALPMPRGQAVVSGMMLSFLVYLVAVLWCFACRSAWRAWCGLLLPALVLAAIDGGLYWAAQP